MACTSVLASHSGFPVSCAIAWLKRVEVFVNCSAKRSSWLILSAKVKPAQYGKAARAASMAWLTCVGEAALPDHNKLLSKGFCLLNALPLPVSHWPLIKCVCAVIMLVPCQIKGQCALAPHDQY